MLIALLAYALLVLLPRRLAQLWTRPPADDSARRVPGTARRDAKAD